LTKVGFRVAEFQWPVFGFEFVLLKAYFRPIPVSQRFEKRTPNVEVQGRGASLLA
jgi:hypothetical protein